MVLLLIILDILIIILLVMMVVHLLVLGHCLGSQVDTLVVMLGSGLIWLLSSDGYQALLYRLLLLILNLILTAFKSASLCIVQSLLGFTGCPIGALSSAVRRCWDDLGVEHVGTA